MSYQEYFSPFFLRAIVTLCLLTTAAAHADEYSEINQLIRSERLSEALVKVDASLAAKPRDPQLRFLKGVIQRNSGKQAEAIHTFTKLTEDFPELPEPYNNLAVLYAGQSQFDKARAALEMAIRTNPSYATAHENLGDVYARLASQAYGSALQLEGANAAVPPKLALIKELFKSPSRVASADNTPLPAATAPLLPAAAKAVPAAVPAVVPPPPAAAPATPAPAPAPVVQPKPVAVDTAAKDVESAVLSWAKAWGAKDMGAYLGAYAREFSPPDNQSRAVWEQERKKRILGKAAISVRLENLSVSVNANKAVVKFRQDYKANALAVSSRKTLTLVKQGNAWLITKESVGN